MAVGRPPALTPTRCSRSSTHYLECPTVGGSSACEQACRRDAPSPSPRPTDRRLGVRAQRRRRAARACALASVGLSTGPPTTGAPPAPGGVVVGRHLDAPFCALVSLWLACCRAPRAIKAARLSTSPLPQLANPQLHHCPSWQTLKNTLARIGYKPSTSPLPQLANPQTHPCQDRLQTPCPFAPFPPFHAPFSGRSQAQCVTPRLHACCGP